MGRTSGGCPPRVTEDRNCGTSTAPVSTIYVWQPYSETAEDRNPVGVLLRGRRRTTLQDDACPGRGGTVAPGPAGAQGLPGFRGRDRQGSWTRQAAGDRWHTG